MFQGITKDLIAIKSHYFFFNAATGPLVTFLPTIAIQLGFSEFLLGIIYFVSPITGLIAKPLFCGLADRWKLQKSCFIFFQVLTVLSFFTIYFIPQVNDSLTLTCDSNIAFLKICSKNPLPDDLRIQLDKPLMNSTECQLSCRGTNPVENNGTWKDDPNQRSIFKARFNLLKDLIVPRNCARIEIEDITRTDGTTHKPQCSNLISTSCKAVCSEQTPIKTLLEEVKKSEESTTHQFYLFLSAAVISWASMAVVVCIADAICFDILGADNRHQYGKQKMWGCIGFGLFSLGAGYLIDILSKNQLDKNYTCIFYIMLIAMIFDIVVSSTFKKKNEENTNKTEPTIFRELFTVLKNGRMLGFAWWCMGSGMCIAAVWSFLFIYIESVGTSQFVWIKTLQGLITGIQCFVGELPFNFLSGSILHKLGHINVMSIVLLTFAVRFMMYSIVGSNIWMFPFLEILHGPTFGLCWPTMVSYGDKAAPPGTKATMQGLIGAVFEGLGVSCGSLICGWLMNSYGGAIMFRILSMGALIWLGIFWSIQLVLKKLQSNPIHQGHNHLVSYANPDDAILMTMSQELQTY